MIWKTSFIAGFIAAMSIRMLIEDFHGQERMIEMVTESWLTPWIGVPCAIAGLLAASYLVWRNSLLEKLLINNIKEFHQKQRYNAIIKGTREERN